MNSTVTIEAKSTPAEEAFKKAALESGIMRDCIEPLVGMKLTSAKYDVHTREIMLAFLQKEFIENPYVLGLFNDFAREMAYDCLIDYIFDVASDVADTIGDDINALPKALYEKNAL